MYYCVANTKTATDFGTLRLLLDRSCLIRGATDPHFPGRPIYRVFCPVKAQLGRTVSRISMYCEYRRSSLFLNRYYHLITNTDQAINRR